MKTTKNRRKPKVAAVPGAAEVVVGGLEGPCLHEFIAIATHPGIYKPASTLAEALGFAESLLAAPQLHLISESPGSFEKLREITGRRLTAGEFAIR